MRKIWLIARREYLFNFRRRSFLFTVFGVPAFTLVMMFVIFAVSENTLGQAGTLGTIGYVDHAGFLAEPVQKPEEYRAFPDEDAAREALLAGEIGAYFVINEDYLTTGRVDAYAGDGIPEGVEDQLQEFLNANLVRLLPPDVPVERLLDPMELTIVDMQTGSELDNAAALGGKIMTPFILALVFLMAINTTSQFLMSSVVEEKESRMMEVLVTSTTPLEILWGKVLGMGGLGLTQVVIWGAAGALLLTFGEQSEFLSGITFPPDLIVLGAIYFILGYFLFGAIMAGIGAAVTAEQEGRQFAGILTLIAVLPMMLAFNLLQEPNGALSMIMSFVPLTAPMTMIIRLSLTVVPAWEVIVSIGLMVLGVLGAVWLSARVFRLGMLMYGKRLSVREIVAALRQGQRVMTTVAQAKEGAS